MKAALIGLALSGGTFAFAQAAPSTLVPGEIKGWVELGGVVLGAATSIAVSKRMSEQALGETKELREAVKEVRKENADEWARMRVVIDGIEERAVTAAQLGGEAQRTCLAVHKRLDEVDISDKHRARWEGEIVGKVEAFHARAEDIGKNVHALRNEVGLMVGRLEERIDRAPR